MFKSSKSLLIIIMITTFTIVPFGRFAYAEEKLGDPSSFDYFIDTIVWRPAGFCGTIMGMGLFIVYLPISIPGKSVSKTYEKLVIAPFNFTFKRPLGDVP